MKQFQKYGVAAAVASVAGGAVAQMAPEVSSLETGDLAIVPYYTVLDGKNTGIHIINTTESTQVIKVRLRRGADSKDALDFNVVLSPEDEWTANIGAGGDTGVQVTTNDNSCTVPAFTDGVAQMPDTYADGATEGYVEIIAMGQPIDNTEANNALGAAFATGLDAEDQHLAVAAKHQKDTGAPLSCDIVRENFYRVAAGPMGDVGDATVRGTHTSTLLSSGVCTAAVATDPLCVLGAPQNLTLMGDSDDNALKVSYFITDSDGGLEAGDNAVMVQGFANDPMMTNQQPLNFGTAGILQFDPLNFELPNLAYGAYESSEAARRATGADGASAISDGSLFDGFRMALDADAVLNDWASFEAADGSTVAADWVVTLPGQYTMSNPICDLYDSYAFADAACVAADVAALADDDELPLSVSSSTTGDPLTGNDSRLALWDREEMPLSNPEVPGEDDLGFSPGGSEGNPTQNAVLNREVNVISWNENSSLNTAAEQSEPLGLGVNITVPGGADRGWGRLTIDPVTPAGGTVDFGGLVDDDADLTPAAGAVAPVNGPTNADLTAVAAVAIWQRSFAAQAGNYGRAVEHSTISSARNP